MAGAEEEKVTQRSQKMGQGEMGIGMLGWRQVIPRWENDPVWLHKVIIRESVQGRLQEPPKTEIRRKAEKGGASLE